MSIINKKIIRFQTRFLRCAYFRINAPYMCNNILTNNTEQIDLIKTVVGNNDPNWSILKQDVLCKKGNLNEKNIDAVLLKVMVNDKKLSAAMSFANHLKLSGQELSLGAINGLLNLYYEYAKGNNLSENDRDFILNTYRTLYDKYKVLDYATSEKLLHALCSINEWKKSVKVLSDITLSSTPTHSAYSTLIGTLFKNNRRAEAIKLIKESVNNRRPLLDYAYDEWIKYIFRKYKDKHIILKYLNEICNHISNNCAVVSVVTAHKLRESFESVNWTLQFTHISKHSGMCKSCNQTLDCLRLSEEEFLVLQKNIKEKLIVGSDLFLKTSPGELKKFMEFVESTAPYDIVLDALNVAYVVGKGDVNDRIRVLTTVVNYFLKENKKILILGRKHMLKWRKGSWLNLMKNTKCFFTEDISQDDPYFITAAILSGSHTDIVSRDLLRGHRFLLQQDELQRLFQRWQWQHQWMVFFSKRQPVIQAPLKFTPIAQETGNGWHLPYQAENMSNLGQVHDGVHDLSSWVCLRPKSV